MRIRSLSLGNWRNYSQCDLAVDPHLVRVVGSNAQGKTNLLEAIYYLGRGQSFRTSHRDDLIRHGADHWWISAQSEHDGLIDDFRIEFRDGRRRLLRNGKAVRSPDSHWPHVVLFAPEETLLFKVGPTERRKYLDTLIAGMDPQYREITKRYTKVLSSRNKVLQQAYELPDDQCTALLAPWTQQLLEYGSKIMEARRLWIQALNRHLPTVHSQFAAQDGSIEIKYNPHVTTLSTFNAQLVEKYRLERIRGQTLVGPQRDEIVVHLNGQDLAHYGSQGQHRSVVLSLKIAELELAREIRGRVPILLLDDVASELDQERTAAFFSVLSRLQCQTLLTTTHLDEHIENNIIGSTWRVHDGEVQCVTYPGLSTENVGNLGISPEAAD